MVEKNNSSKVPNVECDSRQAEKKYPDNNLLDLAYGIRLYNFGLLLPQDIVSRVIDDYQLCPLPTAAKWFLGMANVDGISVPVFDLNLHLFEGKREQIANDQLLIIGVGSESVAIPINTAPIQVDLGMAVVTERFPLLPEALKKTVYKCYQLDIYWLAWDFKKFFSTAGLAV